MVRSVLFRVAYWGVSVFFAITAVVLLPLPNRAPMMRWIQCYTQTMLWLMKVIAGVAVEVRGRERLPAGPCIIAAKHQSWGDGFVMFTALKDLAFVTGDHLERLPLLGGILRKMGAIIVDNCGGAVARAKLVDTELEKAREENRRILIYPEGNLAPVGRRYRYRRGVYHMYKAYHKPAVPVATNLGLFWPQQNWRLTPGVAVVEILDPIEPGLEKEEFMARLEDAIETHSLALLGEQGAAFSRNDPPLPDPNQSPDGRPSTEAGDHQGHAQSAPTSPAQPTSRKTA